MISLSDMCDELWGVCDMFDKSAGVKFKPGNWSPSNWPFLAEGVQNGYT